MDPRQKSRRPPVPVPARMIARPDESVRQPDKSVLAGTGRAGGRGQEGFSYMWIKPIISYLMLLFSFLIMSGILCHSVLSGLSSKMSAIPSPSLSLRKSLSLSLVNNPSPNGLDILQWLLKKPGDS